MGTLYGNVIAEKLLSKLDEEGKMKMILNTFVYHGVGLSSIPMKYSQYISNTGFNRLRCITIL